jgi:hypothetical protein
MVAIHIIRRPDKPKGSMLNPTGSCAQLAAQTEKERRTAMLPLEPGKALSMAAAKDDLETLEQLLRDGAPPLAPITLS